MMPTSGLPLVVETSTLLLLENHKYYDAAQNRSDHHIIMLYILTYSYIIFLIL